MSFLEELQKSTNKTFTENGAVTNKSTLDPLLDFFAMAGAMRENVPSAVKLFTKAFVADRQTAMRTLFYLRDIRGGQGERDLFRAVVAEVAKTEPDVFAKVAHLMPEYGRWDDLVLLFNTSQELVGGIIRDQLAKDEVAMAAGGTTSLLAKWLPSENTSSAKTAKLAKDIAKFLKLKPSQYRRKVVALRKYIKLLEQKMSANEWSDVEYPRLPSQAQRKHVKAFKRHDEERYTAYLEAAQNGEAKMNTSTLYTYEVFDAVQNGDLDAANAMWANLPDYTNGTNALVVADVSSSMTGRPMSVSVSLALYFAEHNKGAFNGYFMTFSDSPQLVKVQGRNLAERLRMIECAQWGMSTNLEAVFNKLLDAAQRSGANGDDMPKVVYIISDMEFNQCVANPSATLFESAQERFKESGLQLPHVVFWNVEARQEQAPATKFDNHVTLISGLSQSTFRYAVDGKTPAELMSEVINSERYAAIVI